MASLLQRRLIVVTGKGGVGKTTIATALGLLAARRGQRTLIVEVGERQHIPTLLGSDQPAAVGVEVALGERLASMSVDPDRALADWLRALGGRVSSRVLLSSTTFQYFVAAAPGAREVLSMVKVLELTESRDLVILDAPATGHALALLQSPQTFTSLARVGPIAAQTRLVSALLKDAQRSAYVAVAQGSEMAVAETLELRDRMRTDLGRELDLVVANAALPRRFQEHELQQIAALAHKRQTPRLARERQTPRLEREQQTPRLAPEQSAARAAAAAAVAARAAHLRARAQNNQIARLRRNHAQVLRVPFLFAPSLDANALEGLSERLERALDKLD